MLCKMEIGSEKLALEHQADDFFFEYFCEFHQIVIRLLTVVCCQKKVIKATDKLVEA